MTDSPEMKELVQRGKAAARVGRLDEARESLGRAIELEPNNIEAWLALAAVEDAPAGKIACFETVLQLDPSNVEASLGLEMLRQDEEPEAAADTGAEDDAVSGYLDPQVRQVTLESALRLGAVLPPESSADPASQEENALHPAQGFFDLIPGLVTGERGHGTYMSPSFMARLKAVFSNADSFQKSPACGSLSSSAMKSAIYSLMWDI